AEFTVYGNSPAGTFVGRVAASDVDGDALTYAIASGDESGAFRIDAATGEIFVLDGGKLNARTTPEIRLTVTVSDGQGGVATATVLVKVRAQAVTFQVNYGNPIDLRGFPWLPVVVYSTDTFDARQVDVRSMTFGRTGDEQSFPHVFGRRFFYYLDMNRDGRLDLVMLFDVRRTGLQEGDTAATLRGRLMDGTEFAGTTPVVVTDGRRRGRR
ncbi:MAG TPA: cadherin repeat domain-containing protein, partial [Planctomycetaceae bacterium]